MLPHGLDQLTVTSLQSLVEANFSCRDSLYEAAQVLGDEDQKLVCQHLAERVADHAVTIQQALAVLGADMSGPPCRVEGAAERDQLIDQPSRGAVLQEAEESETWLKELYDRAAENTPDKETIGMLQRQRREVDFGVRVLRAIRTTAHA